MIPPVNAQVKSHPKVNNSCNCSCPSKCCIWPFRPKGISKHKSHHLGEPITDHVNEMSREIFRLYESRDH